MLLSFQTFFICWFDQTRPRIRYASVTYQITPLGYPLNCILRVLRALRGNLNEWTKKREKVRFMGRALYNIYESFPLPAWKLHIHIDMSQVRLIRIGVWKSLHWHSYFVCLMYCWLYKINRLNSGVFGARKSQWSKNKIEVSLFAIGATWRELPTA